MILMQQKQSFGDGDEVRNKVRSNSYMDTNITSDLSFFPVDLENHSAGVC